MFRIFEGCKMRVRYNASVCLGKGEAEFDDAPLPNNFNELVDHLADILTEMFINETEVKEAA